MHVRFGNLTVAQFEEITGTNFTDEERDRLESLRTDEAAVTNPSTFHIFDDPSISVVVGDEVAHEVVELFTAAHRRSPFRKSAAFYPAPQRSEVTS